MKRSEINKILRVAKEVFSVAGFRLPPYAFWTPDQWDDAGPEADEIRRAMLGWDVTDFGLGNFSEFGRVLFTLRNGYRTEEGFTKSYAEKVILDPPNQKPPLHFHRTKREDIINRGQGNILILLYQSTPDGQCSDEDITVQIDGITRNLKAGSIERLKPGQSICLPPLLIHQFWGEEGTGIKIAGTQYAISGEVSSVCDDWNDNCFLEDVERFCKIEEDEPREHYLCNEYPKAKGGG